MKASIIALIDHVRDMATLAEADRVLLPILTLRYAYQHKERLDLRCNYTWDELSNDRTSEKITRAMNDLGDQIPQIRAGLALFKKPDMKSALTELIYQAGKIDFPENGKDLMDAYFEAGARAKNRAGLLVEQSELNSIGIGILDIQPGTSVYDFSASNGRTLAEVANSQSNVAVYGNVWNEEAFSIAQLYLFICGIKQFHLTNHELIPLLSYEQGEDRQYDYVISHPPLGLKMKNDIHTRFGTVKREASMAYIIYALNSLKEQGKAVVTVSNGTLFLGASTGEIRRILIEDDLIEAVISFAPGVFHNTSIPVSMLVLNKAKPAERTGRIQIIDASALGQRKRGITVLDDSEVTQIIDCYKGFHEDNKLSRVLDLFEIRENRYNLLPSSYMQMEDSDSIIGKVLIDRSTYERKIETVPLRTLARIYRGLNTAGSTETGTIEAKVIQLSDVQHGMLHLDTVETYRIKNTTKEHEAEIQAGDVLLTSRGIAMKFVVVPDLAGRGPFYLSANFIGLQPFAGVDPYFLLTFFESPIGESYIRSLRKGSALPILNVKDIQNIPVPKLSESEMAEIGQMHKKAMEDYARAIELAQQQRTNELERLYEKMGVSKGYKKKNGTK